MSEHLQTNVAPLELLCRGKLPAELQELAVRSFASLNWEDLCWFMRYWTYPGRANKTELLDLFSWLANQVWMVQRFWDSEAEEAALVAVSVVGRFSPRTNTNSRGLSTRDLCRWESEKFHFGKEDIDPALMLAKDAPGLVTHELPGRWEPPRFRSCAVAGLRLLFKTKTGAWVAVQENSLEERVHRFYLAVEPSVQRLSKKSSRPPAKFFLILKQGQMLQASLLIPSRKCEVVLPLKNRATLSLCWSIRQHPREPGTWSEPKWSANLEARIAADPEDLPLMITTWSHQQNLHCTSTEKATKDLNAFVCKVVAEHDLERIVANCLAYSLEGRPAAIATGSSLPAPASSKQGPVRWVLPYEGDTVELTVEQRAREDSYLVVALRFPGAPRANCDFPFTPKGCEKVLSLLLKGRDSPVC